MHGIFREALYWFLDGLAAGTICLPFAEHKSQHTLSKKLSNHILMFVLTENCPETHVLAYFPEEDSTVVVKIGRVSGELKEGSTYNVLWDNRKSVFCNIPLLRYTYNSL